MEGWFLFVGALVGFFIGIPSCVISIFRWIDGENSLLFDIVSLISLFFLLSSIIYFVVNYKDTRKEDCLNSGGMYSDIPGSRGCIYGGSDK